MSTEDTINHFAKRFMLSVEHPEANVYHLGGFELYLPGHNTVLDEELKDFQVYRGVTIPGRMYMPNGDPGYPDDYDTMEVGNFPRLLNALEKIGHLVVTEYIDEEGMAAAFMGDET